MMELTKRQKEKMKELEDALLTFERSEKSAEDYETFMWKSFLYLRGGEHPLMPHMVTELLQRTIKR